MNEGEGFMSNQTHRRIERLEREIAPVRQPRHQIIFENDPEPSDFAPGDTLHRIRFVGPDELAESENLSCDGTVT